MNLKTLEFLQIDQLASSSLYGNNDTTKRVKTEFLVQMQDILKENITVIGVTSNPWKLDYAIRK